MKVNPLDFPVVAETPDRLTDIQSWQGLIPLAYAIMSLQRPSIFVELGTHKGDSYCAFCQAVDKLDLDTACYAVDTWRGEEHAGLYDDSVLQELRAHHDARFSRFSVLLQSTFDAALEHFADGSIDLLHIDGLHTYAAVKHDFESWLPKMSERGVVLFHDTNVREGDFGVWRLWKELSQLYPALEFKFSHGLGLLAVGKELEAPMQTLFTLNREERKRLSLFFYTLGHRVLLIGQKARLSLELESLSKIVEERDGQLRQVWETVGLRDREVERLGNVVEERDGQLRQVWETVGLRDREVERLSNIVVERDGQLRQVWETVGLRDREVERLSGIVVVREREIESLSTVVEEKEEQLRQVWETVGLRDREVERLSSIVMERDGQLQQLGETLGLRERRIDELSTRIGNLQRSISWRITAPLRVVRRYVSSPVTMTRTALSKTVHLVYRRTPITKSTKIRLKNFLFSRFGLFFKHTAAYRNWQVFHGLVAAAESPVNALPSQSDDSRASQVTAVEPAAEFVPLLESPQPLASKARLIAFFLPQFHPIAENDQWWGKGFTEWTNVTRALPQFDGHYQPHLPGELGFYDLRLLETQRRQVELAKLYGLQGFCFYFYWFAGKRLLETPLRQYLANPDLDFPFCLCWANENWSRRWDGLDTEVLIAQQHSAQDDLAFIEYVAGYMKDPRYIRINGCPLLLVYFPSKLPSARKTAKRWRGWCQDHGIGEIFLAYTQSFDSDDPAVYGFDAAIEFPPNNSGVPLAADPLRLINPQFKGAVYDWRYFVERSRNYAPPEHKLFRGVCPSWDNEARRSGRGTVLLHSSPEGYREWLANAINDTVQRFTRADERLVFINAWNEWAEGAHLEPDARFGYAYLQATRDAQANAERAGGRHIVLVSHDAYPHGAQFLALYLARKLSCDFGYQVAMVLLGPGPLKSEYQRYAQVHDLSGLDARGSEAMHLARELYEAGFKAAICNTTVCGLFVETLNTAGLRTTALIHELPGVLRGYGLQAQAMAIAKHADTVVFPSESVETGFRDFADVPAERRRLRPQGLYKRNAFRSPEDISRARIELRRRLGLAPEAGVILGVGFADHRKGIDLFVEAGLALLKRCPNTALVWVGHWDGEIEAEVRARIEASDCTQHFFFPGLDPQTDLYYAGADVYALSSREDPFPSVILESLDVGVPVVAFEGAGGFVGLLRDGCGLLAPAFDVETYAEKLQSLIGDRELASRLGRQGQIRVREDFSFHAYLFDLLEYAQEPVRKVSVIVPNYNYARYLKQRLDSIIEQTYPIYELIVLDDASTDDSLEIVRQYHENTRNIPLRVCVNEENSGSVFKQWLKGVELAQGDYVWIAEADDYCRSGFLEKAMRNFLEPNVVLSYTQSHQIDESGNVMARNYLDYTNDVDSDKWNRDYVCEGMQELSEVLCVKNTIPNVSAVVFGRDNLISVLEDNIEQIRKYKVAGDWFVYSQILQQGRIGYCSESLNYHRRHQKSVTIASFDAQQLAEIISMQSAIAAKQNVSDEAKAKSEHYVETLYRQFKLYSRKHPSPWEHPHIREVVGKLANEKTASRQSARTNRRKSRESVTVQSPPP